MNELERWANFYLLMAAAAATLIGLLFVVITLAAERMPLKERKKPLRFTCILRPPLSTSRPYWVLPHF
jgi:hypothetical protein